jgi:carbon monoxide dehydrogenase subunit G
VLARTLPGCEKLVRENDRFKGDINVKMGPVQGKFQGLVDVLDVKELDSYKMVVDGRGPAGFVKATAQIALTPEGEGTRLTYDSDVQVGGRVASVGQRLIDASARAIVKQSLEGLNEQIKALAARSRAAAAPSLAETSAAPPAVPQTAPRAMPSGAAASVVAAAPVAPAAVAHVAAPVSPVNDARVNGPSGGATAVGSPPRSPSQVAFALGVAKEVTKELLPVRTILIILSLLVLAWTIYHRVKSPS